MDKKDKTMPIRMARPQIDFIRDVAEDIGLPPSTTARMMLQGLERLGRRGAAEVIQHLKIDDDGANGKSP